MWADYDQIDDDGQVLVYPEDIVRADQHLSHLELIVPSPADATYAVVGLGAGVALETPRDPHHQHRAGG